LKKEILEPAWLDFARIVAGEVQRVQQKEAPQTQLWVGETAAAWHSGEHGITDAYESGFWFVDQLATVATMGHKVMCRQCFVGGEYSMIGVNDGFVPRPDYWTGLLFKKLMGSIVLATTQSEPDSSPYVASVRGYLHCAPPVPQNGTGIAWAAGAVTFAFANLDSNQSYGIKLSGSNPDGTRFNTMGGRAEYILTSPTLDSEQILMNGHPLVLDPHTDHVPDVVNLGKQVVGGNGVFSMPPRSYGFVVFSQANAHACKQGANPEHLAWSEIVTIV